MGSDEVKLHASPLNWKNIDSKYTLKVEEV